MVSGAWYVVKNPDFKSIDSSGMSDDSDFVAKSITIKSGRVSYSYIVPVTAVQG